MCDVCACRHSATPPVPIPTSSTVFAFVGAKAASHTASDVGLYMPRWILTRPPSKVKISCFVFIAIYNKTKKIKGKFMFDDIVVVQSAVSAFNNAALWAPAFLWWGVLALPLFIVVWLCGKTIAERIGWDSDNVLTRSALWTAGLTFGWMVLFGGNYHVLRDAVSVLPMMNAGIIFLTALFVSSYLRGALFVRGWKKVLMISLLILLVALSDVHVWWGALLQVGALMSGVALGWYSRGKMQPVSGMVLIVLMVVSAILMQPEFYRFGQLDNLTLGHLVAILLLGMVAVACVVLANVKAQGRIHRLVFVKLKWLLRVLCALGVALFVLTEGMPIFLGTLGVLAILFAISVWHSEKNYDALLNKTFAIMLMLFGAITVMPAVTALGILCWVNSPDVDFLREFKALL